MRNWMLMVLVVLVVACGGEDGTRAGTETVDAADTEAEAETVDASDTRVKTEAVDASDTRVNTETVDASDTRVNTETVDSDGEICAPACDGKKCGPDGCGGSCTECDDSDPCTTNDTCQDDTCAGSSEWPPGMGPKPILVLLLDTSGSMQYVTQNDGDFPVCHLEREPGFAYEKSRWIAIVEALAGTFNDYWCIYDYRDDDPNEEDYLAPPHAVPMGVELDGEVQQPDGLLDAYADKVKFGVMTFDCKWSTELGPSGGFSYGPDKESALIGLWNVGIRNKSAPWGALVAPAAGDDPDAMVAAGKSIQEQIVATAPYGFAPVSPSLDDALFFFQNDDSVAPYSPDTQTGDVYAACRSKAVVLVTDGQPDQGEGNNGYPSSPAAASELLASGIEVHVVAFMISPLSLAESWSHKVALAGGTEEAVLIEDPEQLRSALEAIIQEIGEGL